MRWTNHITARENYYKRKDKAVSRGDYTGTEQFDVVKTTDFIMDPTLMTMSRETLEAWMRDNEDVKVAIKIQRV